MTDQLVKLVTKQLLIRSKVFVRMDLEDLSDLLLPAFEEAVKRDCSDFWSSWGRSLSPSKARSST